MQLLYVVQLSVVLWNAVTLATGLRYIWTELKNKNSAKSRNVMHEAIGCHKEIYACTFEKIFLYWELSGYSSKYSLK